MKSIIEPSGNQIVFEIHTGNCPSTGKSFYTHVRNYEVKEYCGKYFQELSKSEQQDIIHEFNNN